MFLFDPKLDDIYVGNIRKTYISSNIYFLFDPTLSLDLVSNRSNYAVPSMEMWLFVHGVIESALSFFTQRQHLYCGVTHT